MKKLSIILLSLSLFAFVACNNNAKSGDAGAKDADKAAVDTKVTSSDKAVKIGDIEVPNFSDAALNDYAKSYAEYVGKYKDAYAKMKTGDASAFTALSQEGTDLAKKAGELKSGISDADAAKFQEYITKVTKQLTDIASGK